MMRWAVDVNGIDLTEDFQRERLKRIYEEPLNSDSESWRAADDGQANDGDSNELGRVWVLSREEVLDALEERSMEADFAFRDIERATSRAQQQQQQSQLRGFTTVGSGFGSSTHDVGSSSGGYAMDLGGPSNQSLLSGDLGIDSLPAVHQVRVFSTFLSPEGQCAAVTVCMSHPTYRGLDVVSAFLQLTVAPNEILAQRYSTNPRLYKLFIADEYTGEEEMAVQLDLEAHNFSCYAVTPTLAAKLFMFPQRSALEASTARDIPLSVQVHQVGSEGKVVQRICLVPADMLCESLETTICNSLPASGIIRGSLRIVYGPLELNINEYFNFGVGCGRPNCPIADRTVLSLYRFGVREVMVNGRAVEEVPLEALRDFTEDIVIDMSVDDALSFQQFEIICIDKYGARKQRLLCVDGEHLYTMRPNAVEAQHKVIERSTKDIEEVRVFADKPKYMEIAYTKSSRCEEHHFECTTTYNCALLNEKLRVVRRVLRKREAEEQKANVANETAVQRFVSGIRSRWFGGS